jgi:hypothetical protein
LIIYSEDTIHAMTHVGGNDIFAFQRLLSDTRLASGRAIVDISGAHLFLSQENIYYFDGTRNLLPMADKIAIQMREELQQSLKNRAWAFLDKAKNHIYWAIPSSDTTNVIYKMEYSTYDIRQIRWAKHNYASRITAMGFWHRIDGLRFNSASLAGKTYDKLAMRFNQASLKNGFPQRVLGYANAAVLSDDTIWDDNGAAVDSIYDTIDFTVPQGIYLSEYARWAKLEVELRGSSVDVYYSTDHGATFTFVQTLTLTSDWVKYKVDIDVFAATMRFRFRNANASSFEKRWIRGMVTSAGL